MTPHFTFAEAIATRTRLKNTPTPLIAANIGVTALRMESVREALNHNPIRVNSWYRSPTVNKAVGGSAKSDHMLGHAVDFVCKGFGSEYAVACAIRDSSIKFDQLILEYGWVHLSFAPAMRQQVMTKKSVTAPYITGLIE